MDAFPRNLLSWLESRTCGINQRVPGSSPGGGALLVRRSKIGLFFFRLLETLDNQVFHPQPIYFDYYIFLIINEMM